MKKLFNPFVFYKSEYDNKWWHRLAKVLIYATTVTIFIFSIIIFIHHEDEWNTHKYVYSFESTYSTAFGISHPCTFLLPTNNGGDSAPVQCGKFDNVRKLASDGYVSFWTDFLNRYTKATSSTEHFITQTIEPNPYCDNAFYNTSSSSFLRGLSCMKTLTYQDINYDLLNQKIQQGMFNGIRVKEILVRNLLICDSVLVIVIPLVWFIFARFVIYQTVLYVTLGKNRLDKQI